MAIEVFSRFERKYLLDNDTYLRILDGISEYMNPDKYCKDGRFYNIANIYYDTENDYLIRKSLEKPVYKEKLRLRSYGVPDISDVVFMEIKKKYKGKVYKRRTRIKLSDAYELVDKGIRPGKEDYINDQILNEIDYFIKYYKVLPKVYLTYDRMAFFAKNDKNFRVTFDTNIKARREDVGLEKGNQGELVIGNKYWLMEVKSPFTVPGWFTDILNDEKIYPVSFSKYGTEYKNYIRKINNLEEVKGDLICSKQFLKVQ